MGIETGCAWAGKYGVLIERYLFIESVGNKFGALVRKQEKKTPKDNIS